MSSSEFSKYSLPSGGSRLASLLLPLFAVAASFLLSGLFILLTETSPIDGYRHLLAAGFGCAGSDYCALLTTLQFTTPLLLTGLSAVAAFRVGMFSIGQAGQMVLGAAAASWPVALWEAPGVLRLLLGLSSAFLVGGIWGWFPGLLKVRLGVNEVVSTLLLNQLAFLLSGSFWSSRVPEEMRLAVLVPGTKFNSGIFLAVLAAGLLYIFFWRYRSGFEGRMAGEGFRFATYAGMPGRQAILKAMLISGGLAGLAGGIEVLGVHYRFVSVFSGGGSFDGIAVAMLGGVHPLGVPVAAFLLAGLRLGATNGLQLAAHVPRELGGAMIAMMILLASGNQFFVTPLRRLRARLRDRRSLNSP
jgi:simple sugar transport system permease protein